MQLSATLLLAVPLLAALLRATLLLAMLLPMLLRTKLLLATLILTMLLPAISLSGRVTVDQATAGYAAAGYAAAGNAAACAALLLATLLLAMLLLALLLSEVRHARHQVVAELKLLSQTMRNQLDRPSLLDAAHYARLTALGQGVELLARRLDSQWLIGAGGVDSKTLDQAAQRLQSLAAQRKPVADHAQMMEQLARETVAGDRALPGSG
jgi:hypothetical protein